MNAPLRAVTQDLDSSQIPRTVESSQRALARAAAWLLFLGLVTGIYAAAGLSGMLPIDGRTALGAHVSALSGAFILFALAWTLPMLKRSDQALERIGLALIVATYGNWIVTAVKAVFHVAGVGLTASVANNVVFGILNVVVVFPALIATFFWATGFRRD